MIYKYSAKLNSISHILDAHYIALEHRFYGDSNPTKDLSTANLKFLSSQQGISTPKERLLILTNIQCQRKIININKYITIRRFFNYFLALADAAFFIETMKKEYTGPWIVFGCSYSGALSAWFRSKYPNVYIIIIRF